MTHANTPVRRTLMLVAMLLATLVIQPTPPADAATWTYCSGSVCQELQYSGQTVTKWQTEGYSGTSYSCHTAKFWVNGGLYDTEYRCGYYWLTAYGPTPRTWSSGTQLCTSWSGITGMVCKTM